MTAGGISWRSAVLLAAVALMGGGCSAASPSAPVPLTTDAASVSAPPTESPDATATPRPTPTAPPGSAIGRRWDYLQDQSPSGYLFYDAVFGHAGWVAVGECGSKACDPPLAGGVEMQAAAAWSPGGRTWTRAKVEDATDAMFENVTSNGSAYFATGVRYARPGDARVPIWRSTDGRRWDHIGTIDPGACSGNDCDPDGPLAATAAGQLVIGWVDMADAHEARSGTYWSADGRTWEVVDLPRFRSADGAPAVVDVLPFGSGLVLVGRCGTCATASVWTSGDGRTWDRVAELGGSEPWRVSLTSSGSLLMATLLSCSGADCSYDFWGSEDGRGWTRLAAGQRFGRLMAFAGGVFVAVDSGPEQGKVATSPDGRIWTEFVPDEGLESGGDCGIGWVAGHADTLVAGDPDCAWISYSAATGK